MDIIRVLVEWPNCTLCPRTTRTVVGSKTRVVLVNTAMFTYRTSAVRNNGELYTCSMNKPFGSRTRNEMKSICLLLFEVVRTKSYRARIFGAKKQSPYSRYASRHID